MSETSQQTECACGCGKCKNYEEIQYITCPGCGYDRIDGLIDKTCSNCGRSLREHWYSCTKCGNEVPNPPEFNRIPPGYCNICGTPMVKMQ